MLEAEQATRIEQLLRILIQLGARSGYPEDKVKDLISRSPKQIVAYNLCDGNLTQRQVAKKAGLDEGNFSRTVARWMLAGVLFKLGEGREAKLLHLYPLTNVNTAPE
jgi:hypothetical protein